MTNVFITGASSGIGAALARQYAERGATLGLVARNPEKLRSLIDSLPGDKSHYFALPADVTKRDEILAAAQKFEELSGGADIVIANAGISHGVKTEFYEDLDVLEKVYQTNVFAMAYTFHAFINPMKKRGHGQLVGIASVSGIRGLPGSEAYCASKSAVITYTESLRVELGKVGLRVQTICPGFVATPLTAKNPYKMPFILTADEFATLAVKKIDAGTSYCVLPWQMGILAKILRILPNWLFDKILAKRKQKPRIASSTETPQKDN
ncbi:short-chain dehydrogenase/reductase sdr [gut metagenome]|uniref:Short-chain dehydrogenase/reductase sdr n=1 Tax=gut metagenome TaxID=749906 RepID=J9GK44_9ZZZZ